MSLTFHWNWILETHDSMWSPGSRVLILRVSIRQERETTESSYFKILQIVNIISSNLYINDVCPEGGDSPIKWVDMLDGRIEK